MWGKVAKVAKYCLIPSLATFRDGWCNFFPTNWFRTTLNSGRKH
jgi:hypothetical protein